MKNLNFNLKILNISILNNFYTYFIYIIIIYFYLNIRIEFEQSEDVTLSDLGFVV